MGIGKREAALVLFLPQQRIEVFCLIRESGGVHLAGGLQTGAEVRDAGHFDCVGVHEAPMLSQEVGQSWGDGSAFFLCNCRVKCGG